MHNILHFSTLKLYQYVKRATSTWPPIFSHCAPLVHGGQHSGGSLGGTGGGTLPGSWCRDHDLPIFFLILFQLFTLLIIPLLLSIGCYQAVIRWAPDSVKGWFGKTRVLWRSARNIHSLTGCAGTSNAGGARIRCHTFRHIRGTLAPLI